MLNLFRISLFSFVCILFPSFALADKAVYFFGGLGYGLDAPFVRFNQASFSRSQLINTGIMASVGVGYQFSNYVESQLELLKGEDVSLQSNDEDLVDNNFSFILSLLALFPVSKKINIDIGVGSKFNFFNSNNGFTLKQGGRSYVIRPGEHVRQFSPEIIMGVSSKVVTSMDILLLSRYDPQYMKSPESYSFELALRWIV